MADFQEFWESLNKGPAVLFLGQSYVRLDTGVDPFLVQIQEKFGGSVTSGAHYDLLLEGTANQSNSAALS